jgi:hypothetical protein
MSARGLRALGALCGKDLELENGVNMNEEQVRILEKLALGIIPADERDDGAACVEAGRKIADKVGSGVNAKVYLEGVEVARRVASERFGREMERLEEKQVQELLEMIRAERPGVFKQLRMDVSAIYLSDPGVWGRIGFPGPASESGGYADFDREQGGRIIHHEEHGDH